MKKIILLTALIFSAATMSAATTTATTGGPHHRQGGGQQGGGQQRHQLADGAITDSESTLLATAQSDANAIAPVARQFKELMGMQRQMTTRAGAAALKKIIQAAGIGFNR